MSKLDRSSETIVVHCPECPAFRRLFLRDDEGSAHAVAVAHEQRAHPGSKGAMNARRYFDSKAA